MHHGVANDLRLSDVSNLSNVSKASYVEVSGTNENVKELFRCLSAFHQKAATSSHSDNTFKTHILVQICFRGLEVKECNICCKYKV